jgi:hypothetical protein
MKEHTSIKTTTNIPDMEETRDAHITTSCPCVRSSQLL